MRHRSRRTLTRVAATGFVLSVAGLAAGITTDADASPAAPHYSARSSASLVHVTALNNGLLSVANSVALADLRVAMSDTVVDSGHTPRSSAASSNVEASLLGHTLPTLPRTTSRQTAGPDNSEVRVVAADPVDLGLATVGLGKLRSQARWTAAMARPSRAATLAESAGAVADVTLIPGAGLPIPVPYLGSSVADLPNSAFSQSRSSVVGVPGQHGLGVASAARVSAAQLTIFGGTPQQYTVKIISPPTLQVVAAGTQRSSVQYSSPIVELVDAHGNSHRIDAPNSVLEIPLSGTPSLPGLHGIAPLPLEHAAPVGGLPLGGQPSLPGLPSVPTVTDLLPTSGLPGFTPSTLSHQVSTTRTSRPALLRLSLGQVQKRITPNEVSARAATVRLELLDLGHSGKLLDLSIGELTASATVPSGGLQPPAGSDGGGEPGSGDGTEPGAGDGAEPGAGGVDDHGGATSADADGPGAPGQASGPGTPGSNGGGSAGGGNAGGSPALPVTGTALTVFLAAGVGLVLTGRFAMVLARRFR